MFSANRYLIGRSLIMIPSLVKPVARHLSTLHNEKRLLTVRHMHATYNPKSKCNANIQNLTRNLTLTTTLNYLTLNITITETLTITLKYMLIAQVSHAYMSLIHSPTKPTVVGLRGVAVRSVRATTL